MVLLSNNMLSSGASALTLPLVIVMQCHLGNCATVPKPKTPPRSFTTFWFASPGTLFSKVPTCTTCKAPILSPSLLRLPLCRPLFLHWPASLGGVWPPFVCWVGPVKDTFETLFGLGAARPQILASSKLAFISICPNSSLVPATFIFVRASCNKLVN